MSDTHIMAILFLATWYFWAVTVSLDCKKTEKSATVYAISCAACLVCFMVLMVFTVTGGVRP